ncbi:hypothetical protein DY052_09215 [Apilactobacillus timberlakei]|uniref:hypothetical protein n=1 Tax=Apilactobacillus timberlakei TaxID=2008380 RepID=UPI00112B1365|nr:hypothetical protein [Apilactobacillus timberlakei]TPR12491.1 hypothetical protein DY052_09215 [Apilactobacillus timberlakei]
MAETTFKSIFKNINDSDNNNNMMIKPINHDKSIYRCSYLDSKYNPNNHITPQISFLIGTGAALNQQFKLQETDDEFRNNRYYLIDELNLINPVMYELRDILEDDNITFDNWFHQLIKVNQLKKGKMNILAYRVLYNHFIFKELGNQSGHTVAVELANNNNYANKVFFDFFFKEYLCFVDNYHIYDESVQSGIFKLYKTELSDLLIRKPSSTRQRYLYGNNLTYISDVIQLKSNYKYRTINPDWCGKLKWVNQRMRFAQDPRPSLYSLNRYLMGTNDKSWQCTANYINMPINQEVYNKFKYINSDYRNDIFHYAISVKDKHELKVIFFVVLNSSYHFELYVNNVNFNDRDLLKIKDMVSNMIHMSSYKLKTLKISM